jgi:hypothetical protein
MKLLMFYKICDGIKPNKQGWCLWPRGKGGPGRKYGVVYVGGRDQLAHRVALERKIGRLIRFSVGHIRVATACV